MMRLGAFEEEQGHVRSLLLSGLPVSRVLFSNRDFNRCNGLSANESAEVQQPLFAEEANVEVDTVQCSKSADRVRSILENTSRVDGIWRLEEVRQSAFVNIVIELLVIQLPSRERLLAPALRDVQARHKSINSVHRARIVDVVG